MDRKLIKIGDSIFDSQVENNYYYVDKTLLIKDLLDHPAEVTSFYTRYPEHRGNDSNTASLSTRKNV
jgi:hypothetical protein